MVVKLASVYRIEGFLVIGKARIGIVVNLDFKASKASCASGVQLKLTSTSLALWRERVISEYILTYRR